MIVIPAIDLRGGKCVRLTQGMFDKETVYSDDPVNIALKWKEDGAEIIHVVDLDGALSGSPENYPVIEKIVKITGIKVEVGGGIRNIKTAEAYMNRGVSRIVIGTALVKDPEFFQEAANRFKGAVIAGIDVKNGKAALSGWLTDSGIGTLSLIQKAKELGAAGVIYTDISKDGTLEGIDIEKIEPVLKESGIPFIISGGVSSIKDIENARKLGTKYPLLEGIIAGKALYAGALNLKEAIERK